CGRRQREDGALRVAPDDVEACAARGEFSLHCGEGLCKPPLRRAAERARAAARLVVDINEERWKIGRGVDRWLVVEAKVVAQPDDIGARRQKRLRRVARPRATHAAGLGASASYTTIVSPERRPRRGLCAEAGLCSNAFSFSRRDTERTSLVRCARSGQTRQAFGLPQSIFSRF